MRNLSLFFELEKLPKIIKNDEFYKAELEKSFMNFKELVKNSKEYSHCYPKISKICDIILNALGYELNGMNMNALLEIQKLFDKNEFGNYLSIIKLKSSNNKILYRGREGRHIEDAYEMLHIPFNKRHNVPTSRYGIYGYPCLYISTSVYGCWLEINKPKLEDFFISRFELKEDLVVLNLANKGKCKTKEDREKYLYTWPLICASSIVVKEEERLFKSEYIIPQLLVQCIRSVQYENKNAIKVDGIRYFSNKISYNEIITPEPLYINYIIMTDISNNVIINNNEYSNKIIDSFDLTIPVNAARLRNINSLGLSSLRKRAENLNVKLPSIKEDLARRRAGIEIAKNTYIEYENSEFYYIEECLCSIPAQTQK